MDGQRDALRLLARALYGAAAAVLVFSVFGAIELGTSETQIPLFGEFQQENRGLMALGALGGGVVGAGILAALGAILNLMLDREDHS